MRKHEVVNVSGKVLGTFDNEEEAHAFADLQVNFAYVEDNMKKTWAIIIKTPDGYMVYDPITDDYVCDVKGDNLFDIYMDAEKLLNTYNEEN
jgi:hypothetical protein